MYIVYILKSEKVNRYYIGHTEDLIKRVKEHNSGKMRSTKGYLPWKTVYTEEYETKSGIKGGYKFKELMKSERWQSG